MKQGIHPVYVACTITCSCGAVYHTHSTRPQIHIEVCAKCHPFFTGQQRFVDTAGRVEKFRRKYQTQDTRLKTQDSKRKTLT